MTNRKLNMRFRLTPRSMTLDDNELYKFEFSENLAGFRTQQQRQRQRCKQLNVLFNICVPYVHLP